MKRLIINSDDYGRTPEISRGIREAHVRGVVTSTTCMMNFPNTAPDIALALQESPDLGLGVHLVLTTGRPVSPPERVPGLVDRDGRFFSLAALRVRLSDLRMDEVKREWQAQVEAFVQAAGRGPTHLDSHHHSSYFSPDLFQGMLELAQDFDCPIRFPFTGRGSQELGETSGQLPGLMEKFSPRHPDSFIVDFYDEGATREALIEMINGLPEGVTEIMCHPGHTDAAFADESVYNRQRDRELEILTDPSVREAIESRGIQLISFAALQA